VSHDEIISVVRLAYRSATVLRAEALRIHGTPRAVRLLQRAATERERARRWHLHLDAIGVQDADLDDLRLSTRPW